MLHIIIIIRPDGSVNAHHVSLDEIKTQRDLFDALVDAVDAFFGVGENNV